VIGWGRLNVRPQPTRNDRAHGTCARGGAGASSLLVAGLPRLEGPAIAVVRVRDAIVSDHVAVLALNNGAVPHVNELSAGEFAWIAAHADYFRVAEDDTGVAGFVIALAPGLEYWSLNYRWFMQRGGGFLYLDRIVVAARARGTGIGRALYDDIGRFARGKWPCITLEVNLRPPNPGSLAFHERLGFRRVGVREEEGGTKAVALMERATSPSFSSPDTGDPGS
jgi:predicted GNAT superfamily acetyltransferase